MIRRRIGVYVIDSCQIYGQMDPLVLVLVVMVMVTMMSDTLHLHTIEIDMEIDMEKGDQICSHRPYF